MRWLLAGLAVLGSAAALAQQAAAPAPAFAPPNLTPAGVRDLAANCAACHGTAGRPAPGSPLASLAGRPRDELVQILGQFKAGQRPATLMHQVAKGYSDAEIGAIAEHFSRLPR
ncbi:MAG TPA: c-type cytochrome [Usitatibacter sp.]|nr:c-type cytochrome [Usitatibacter sp.]